MNAAHLSRDDVFAEIPTTEYDHLNDKQRADLKLVTVNRSPEPCPTDAANLHLDTSRGRWCIPAATPVTIFA